MAGSIGSGTSDSPQPCRANSRRRPVRTASASSGSGKEAKNCHGVLAAHSSPMNTIGVNGEQNTSAAPQASRSRRHGRGQPVAGRAVADLVVVLQVDEETVARQVARVDRAAVGPVRGTTTRCRRGRTPRVSDRGQRSGAAEVGVVAAASRRSARRAGRGGSRRSTGRPGRSRRPRAASISRGSFRSDSAISVSGRPTAADSASTSAASSSSTCTARRSSSACTASSRSAVDVVVAQPHQRVVDDVPAHLVGAGAVEVERRAPGRSAPVKYGPNRSGSCRDGPRWL